jgi:hypothetical protein
VAGYFAAVEAEIAAAHTAHAEMLERVPAGLAASLPVDATGVTRGIEILAAAVGIEDELRAERDRLNRANPAVLHGRVFGRVPLGSGTVVAAFAEGARVRAVLLERLAEAIDGAPLRDDVHAVLAASPLPDQDTETAVAALRAAYEAQERAVLLCAGRLDAPTREDRRQ